MTNRNDAVDQYVSALEHPHNETIELVRSAILASNGKITEQIKWNAPGFGLQGDDRVTFRLQPKDRFQIVFHRGAKVKDLDGLDFADDTGW